ncbi:hypothetical protein ACTXJR_05760 [Glutamicibacter ardleyensis]|uniref:hypothetical protein n=1 Tax=Glutamicibacter ardleyensis TaxID=225894 RepID=UPI003FD115F5
MTGKPWSLDKLRANFEWGGNTRNDPAEFDRVIEATKTEAKAEAIEDLARQSSNRFEKARLNGEAYKIRHGAPKLGGVWKDEGKTK